MIPSSRVNRRTFLSCSAAAGLALTQPPASEPPFGEAIGPVRLALIGAGTRGTALLRALLERPDVQVVAVADREARHRDRARGIVAQARGHRPEGTATVDELLGRPDVDAWVAAVPCDKHAAIACSALEAGTPLYLEKPLAPTLLECDRVLASFAERPGAILRVGFQRRSHPRYRAAAELVRAGEIGTLLDGRASWSSSNGPIRGHEDWLGRRERSGDFMVEQAVHVWDVFRWITGALPVRAFGLGRAGVFRAADPRRDVTDHYAAILEWADGFHVQFVQSWTDPADDAFTGVGLKLVGTEGGIDLATGAVTFRDRSRPRLMLHPGPQPDTKLALDEFLAAVRAEAPAPGPVSLAEARDATRIGLLVRKAVDERRVVLLDEVD